MDATRIAHLSDVHMLASRAPRGGRGHSMGHRFLSFGRPLDAEGRRRKLDRALAAARRVGAHHIVVSGDLTEIGAPAEFEALAEGLHDSGVDPERVTLVPGNHDLYTSPTAWTEALDGPLRAFRRSSLGDAHGVVDAGAIRLLPVDVARHQPLTRSAGWIAQGQVDALAARAADAALADRPLLVVQHHPPFERATAPLHWLDGLAGASRLMQVLERFRHLVVLHGHLHAAVSRVLSCGVARVFGATAVVDDPDAARVRIYDARGGALEAAGLAS